MMKKVNAMIFTLMMLTVPLAGCTGDDEPAEVLGCKNTQANNYNENVTKDDGSCDYDLDDDGVQDIYEVDGCTDDTANNLDLGATDDDGSCDYDLDDDGVLDADEILGCMDSAASNYNENATDDDGSCTDRTAVAITTGYYHTCAILDDGSVSCWGNNGDGQLGDGTTTNRNTSAQTSSLGADRTAVAITGGEYHTCAILDDGSVSCWGDNAYRQRGDGSTDKRLTPTPTSS